MKTINKKKPTIWQLDKWYEKTVYIIGWIWTVIFGIGFIVGLVSEI